MLRRNTAFPTHCCAKCGELATDPVRRYYLSWNPRWFDLLWLIVFLLSLVLLFLISPDLLIKSGALFVVLMVTLGVWAVIKQIVWRPLTIFVPLCVNHQWRNTSKMAAIVGGVLFIGLSFVGQYYSYKLLVFFSWLFLGFLIWRSSSQRANFSAEKMNKEYVYIKGCGEKFLASLPEFGCERRAERHQKEAGY
ncbi:MAG: hypothetical protein FWF41_06270 [Betaproteobacteria bacterium]|nr:hypothetical protein [Betaproteobacteria bacterium]